MPGVSQENEFTGSEQFHPTTLRSISSSKSNWVLSLMGTRVLTSSKASKFAGIRDKQRQSLDILRYQMVQYWHKIIPLQWMEFYSSDFHNSGEICEGCGQDAFSLFPPSFVPFCSNMRNGCSSSFLCSPLLPHFSLQSAIRDKLRPQHLVYTNSRC